jgi:4-nitrophenyl phosphatase
MFSYSGLKRFIKNCTWLKILGTIKRGPERLFQALDFSFSMVVMDFFSTVRALIIDMDGVLWHGAKPMPGLLDFFQMLEKRRLRYILATNNASHTPAQYVDKLAAMGINISEHQIVTSGTATAAYLAERNDPAATRVFIVGEDGLRLPLLQYGFTLTDLYEINNPASPKAGADIVICGKDETLTWDKLATATLNLRAGAQFIGTNGDTTLPTELGVIHGNGAILAALQTATGMAPTIIGKPEPIIYRQALRLLEVTADETLAIGDRLETDILGAHRAGLRSIMVLTGISSREDLNGSDYQPTWVMQDISEITQIFMKSS